MTRLIKEAFACIVAGMEIGPPVTTSKILPEPYFAGVYKDAKQDIEAIIRRFGIRNKRILSIGSGFGAEENLFAELGGNTVVCIEPDEFTASFHKVRAAHSVEVRNISFQDFMLSHSDAPFDLIYTSSPTDWMSTPPTRGMPQRYADVMERTVANGIFLARLYSTYFKAPVLRSTFLRHDLYHAFKEKGCGAFEYWITDNGRCATFVAMRGGGPTDADTPLLGSRFAQPVSRLPIPLPRRPFFFERHAVVAYAMWVPAIRAWLAAVKKLVFKKR